MNAPFFIECDINGHKVTIRGTHEDGFDAVDEVIIDGATYLPWNIIERGRVPDDCLEFEAAMHSHIISHWFGINEERNP